MQETSDIFLGYEHVLGFDGVERDFYVRQLRDWKGAALVETMTPATLAIYGRLCGWTLARAHARSGDRVAIASYLGGSDAFDVAIAEFSEAYADQNERDYDALVQAEKGRPHHRPARPLTRPWSFLRDSELAVDAESVRHSGCSVRPVPAITSSTTSPGNTRVSSPTDTRSDNRRSEAGFTHPARGTHPNYTPVTLTERYCI